MRCEDLNRQLASPTGAEVSAEMAEHLAACPVCAERSRRATSFDQIWEATRPAGPSMGAMDALWARASLELDALQTPATLKFETSGRRRRLVVAAFIAAQAATILIASLVLLRRGGDQTEGLAEATIPDFVAIEAGFDEPVTVRIGKGAGKSAGHVVERQNLAPLFNSSVLPADMPVDQLNGWETATTGVDLVSIP